MLHDSYKTNDGIESLSDVELIAAIIGSDKECYDIATDLIDRHGGSIASLSQSDSMKLRMDRRLTNRQQRAISLALELANRASKTTETKQQQCTVRSAKDIVDIFRPKIVSLKYEVCWVIYLTSNNNVIEYNRVGKSGIRSVVIDQRVIIKRALELLSPQIILLHNHPSGSIKPSQEDIEVTHEIKRAAAQFNVNVVDHIILTESDEFSFFLSGKL